MNTNNNPILFDFETSVDNQYTGSAPSAKRAELMIEIVSGCGYIAKNGKKRSKIYR